ncbi:MAG: peptidylprolyl isomerase [Chloroflexota bacterium]
MAKRKQKAATKSPLTAGQVSRVRQQRRRQRILRLCGAAFIGFIIVFVGFGYYFSEVKPNSEPAIKVNDKMFTMGYYNEALKIYPAEIAAEGIISTELMIQGAAALGITVDNSEVQAQLKEANLPSSRPAQQAVMGSLLQPKLTEHFGSQIAEKMEQVQVQYMLLETEEGALAARNRLEAAEDFAAVANNLSVKPLYTPPAEPVWLAKGLAELKLGNKVIEDIAFSLSKGQISQPVEDADVQKRLGYWIIELTEKKDDNKAAVRAILLGSLQEAKDVEAKLKAGEDFAALAQQFSQHSSKDKGGDLGEIEKGPMGTIFDEAAFALEPGQVSVPVRDDVPVTKGGYWLVQAVDREEARELSKEDRDTLINNAFQKWLEALRENGKVENLVDKKETPATPAVQQPDPGETK